MTNYKSRYSGIEIDNAIRMIEEYSKNGNPTGSNSIELVDEFPISPMPYVLYMKKSTLEIKVYTSVGWEWVLRDQQSITNLEILEILNT